MAVSGAREAREAWNLMPGRYTLSASAQGRRASDRGLSYVRTYFPNDLHASDAGSVTVTPGHEASATIRMRTGKLLRVQGQVVEAVSHAPIRDALFLHLRQQTAYGKAMLVATLFSKDGHFDFANVLPGSYALQPGGTTFRSLDTGDTVTARYCGRHSLVVSEEDVTDLRLALSVGMTVTGTFESEGQVSPERSDPGVEQTPHLLRIQLIPEQGNQRSYAAQSNASGAFAFQHVCPNRYYVHATGLPLNGYVKAVRSRKHGSMGGSMGDRKV
jgi:hypothetical protein